jgi:OMF family outer membrane factor
LYYNAQALQYQIRFTDSSLTNLKQVANQSEVLRNQQMIKGSDFTRIELQVEQLSTQKEIVINKYEQVIGALKFAMGISAERNIEVLPLEELSAPRNYNRAVSSDIKLAMMQENRTRAELRALKLSYIPSLSIFATYGTTGLGYNKSPNEFFNFYPMGFVGVQMVYPLFDGTITLRKIKQKKLELENNELLTSLANEQNEMLLTNAKRYRQQAYQTVLNAKNQIQLSKTIYEQVKLQHAEGLASMTDALLADNSFRESEQTYLNAVIEFLKSDIELKQLSGEKLYNK